MLIENRFIHSLSEFKWHKPIFWAVYCLIVVWLYELDLIKISLPLAIPAVVGTAVSLFLSFRTNSAYQRWWEARKVWGEIVNNGRILTARVLVLGDPEKGKDVRERIVKRQIAWNWTLANRLREENALSNTGKYLEKEELQNLESFDHIPGALLRSQLGDLEALNKENAIDEFNLRHIDKTLEELYNAMGKCERIKSTVFPTQYVLFTLLFINIFLVLLPFGMAGQLGYISVLIQLVIGFIFGMSQSIAGSMQDPFSNDPNDTPVFAICRTIERNLLESLGESSLPKTLMPEKGILM